MSYTPLGLLATRSVRGKTSTEGDQSRASTLFLYELQAFDDLGQPLSVRTIRSVHHDTELDVPEPQRDERIVSVEYSDGFGLARASNTTPVIVLRFEADNPAALERIKHQFRAALQPLKPNAPLPY